MCPIHCSQQAAETADLTNSAKQLHQLLLRHVIQKILQISFVISTATALRSWGWWIIENLVYLSAMLFVLVSFQIL